MDFVQNSPGQLDEMVLVYPGVKTVDVRRFYTRYGNEYDDLGRVSHVPGDNYFSPALPVHTRR